MGCWIEFAVTERPLPAQNLVNLFFFMLLTCSGAVGIQAFSSIHMRTSILLFRMKVVILAYAFVRLVWHIHAHVHRTIPVRCAPADSVCWGFWGLRPSGGVRRTQRACAEEAHRWVGVYGEARRGLL